MSSQSFATHTTIQETSSDRRGVMDRRYVTAALMLVMVLASMEQTVTSTAMPTIIGELRGFERYSWVASIYLLACTVSMPLYGRLSDVWGRKRVIAAAILLFSVSSAMAASSHTMTQLIVYRGLQGLGAGGIMPVVLTILGDIFTLQERAAVQGFFSAIWGTASLAGPALGALLVKTLGWRSIFFVNLPAGLLGLLVLAWKYHDKEKPHSTDLDLPGVAALCIGCASILALASGSGLPGAWDAVLAVVAVASVALFIRIEKTAANPVMPPALMMQRAIGPAMIASGLLGVGFLSLDTYVPLYVQGGLGGGVEAAAGVVTPVMLTWALSGIFAAPLVIRWGFRNTALLGTVLTVIAFGGLLACVLLHAHHWVLTGVLAIAGLGFGPASMGYLLAAQDSVTWQQRGIITSGIQFFRTMGGAIGIGLLGMLFNLLIRPQLRHLHDLGVDPASLLQPDARNRLAPPVLHDVQGMIAGGLLWVFVAMVVFAVLQVLVTALMSGHKAEHPISKVEAFEAVAG